MNFGSDTPISELLITCMLFPDIIISVRKKNKPDHYILVEYIAHDYCQIHIICND